MKRPLHNSETLITLGPSDDEKVMYGRGYQSMMDGLDDEDCIDDDELNSAVVGQSGGKSGEKKRRLCTDQVRALEKNFEVDNKLEPERKLRLAHELGLQPRQVAVWFQNRRARWKTKQLEKDYAALKASYDSLRVDYDALNQDKDALLTQINELKAKLAEEESMSFSSVKEEPVVYKDDDEKLIFSNSEELHPLIYKNGASTDSDSSAVLNDTNLLNDENSPPNSNMIASHAAKDYENSYGFMVFSSGSSASLMGSADHNPIKVEGFSSIFHHYHHHNPIMKIEESEFEEEPCSSFFTDEQAPSLNWWN